METSTALILYQNMLFGEGLESILVKNNYSVSKFPIPKNNSDSSFLPENPDILLIEFNWPCQSVNNFINSNNTIHRNGTKTILIPNIVNRNILRLIRNEKIFGVVLKCSDVEEFIFAIKQVQDGKSYYSSLVSNLLFNDKTDTKEIKVSKREKEILRLLAEMKTTAEIAESLSISPSTVKTHRRNLLQKFNAKSLLCLLRYACRENLLKDETDLCGCCYKQFLEVVN